MPLVGGGGWCWRWWDNQPRDQPTNTVTLSPTRHINQPIYILLLVYLHINLTRSLRGHKSLRIQNDPINGDCRNTARRRKKLAYSTAAVDRPCSSRARVPPTGLHDDESYLLCIYMWIKQLKREYILERFRGTACCRYRSCSGSQWSLRGVKTYVCRRIILPHQQSLSQQCRTGFTVYIQPLLECTQYLWN